MKHSSWLITLAILCALALSAAILACGSEEPTEREESTPAERATTPTTSEGTTAVPATARSRFAFTGGSEFMLDLVPATALSISLLDIETIRENRDRFPGNFQVFEQQLMERIGERFFMEEAGIEEVEELVILGADDFNSWGGGSALIKGSFDFSRIRADFERSAETDRAWERGSIEDYSSYVHRDYETFILLEDIGVVIKSTNEDIGAFLNILNGGSGSLANAEGNDLKRILDELGASPVLAAFVEDEDSNDSKCSETWGVQNYPVAGCLGIGLAYSGSNNGRGELYVDIVALFESEEAAEEAADESESITRLMEMLLSWADGDIADHIGLAWSEDAAVDDLDADDDIVTSTGTMKLGELLPTPTPRPTRAPTATPAPTLSGAACAPLAQPRTDWDPAYHLRTIEVRSVNKRGYSNARLEYVVANPGASRQWFYLDSKVISHPEMFSEFNRYPMSELDIRAGHGTEIGEDVHPDGARDDERRERIAWQSFDPDCPLQIEISVYADPNRRNLLESVLVTLDFDQQGDVTDASIDFGSETTESRPQATQRPAATPAPRAQAAPAPEATPASSPQTDGGPGAVYRGDGNWAALAGPAARPDYQGELGDSDWQVPLDAILQYQWIFESGYYRSLVDKAGLDNPTPLTSSGQDITLKFACVNRNLYWCQHLETHFVPNVAERTNGQVRIEVSSFPELGMAGSDTGQLLAEGWVEMAEIYGGYVAREFPSWELQYLWGLWPDDRSRFEAQTAMAPSLDAMVAGYMDSQPLFRNWIADGGLFLFSDEALEAPEDFGGLKVRSFGASLTDWITGMGGEPQFISFLEISSRLGGHSLDAAAATANAAYNAAYGQRWYHVADYMNGPLYSLDSTIVAVSNHVWHGIPTDLQLILIEEGARHELESLRLATIQGTTVMERITGTGIQLVEFSPEIQAQSRQVAIECVIPGWLEFIGHPSTGRCAGSIVPVAQSAIPAATPAFRPTPAAVASPTGPTPPPTASVQQTPSAEAIRAVDLFNRHVGPIAGLRIESDGTVTELR